MTHQPSIAGYAYSDAQHNQSHAYLLPHTIKTLKALVPSGRRVFDLGCGNGSVSNVIHHAGYHVCGVDPSQGGIAQANRFYPHLQLRNGSAYDDLATQYGRFDAVVSLEVVEHVYAPRDYSKTVFSLLNPGGIAIISTPYHGYFKNLAIAAAGKFDQHATALWDHGHIKFWSIKTLQQLLAETGFKDISFARVGRIPALAKSMIATALRPF